MSRIVLVLAALMLALPAGPAAADNRTQLERLVRIPPEDAGRFSRGQLTAIFHILNDSDLNDNTRKRRIEAIKGRDPRRPGGSRLF